MAKWIRQIYISEEMERLNVIHLPRPSLMTHYWRWGFIERFDCEGTYCFLVEPWHYLAGSHLVVIMGQ
jgi:hypothetical protein